VPPASASLYRRHRPRTFADVVGQEHVVRTLRNAIDQGKVHHAYLFVGSRGTGKTSMAKILAAALNCQGPGGPSEPCGECDSCVSIANATSLDVIEMDAASNNSVDDIRDLREKVAYAPVAGRHKVYILDEAHMLSTAAWNAFLKTLEEPPPHTIFVLATTEAGKVLPTVVDRCHRFDFARPAAAQIAGVLRRVAEAEGIEISDEACALIARAATGSFRDALGTLEQLLAYSGTSISLDDVLAVLGAADADLLFGTVDAVAAGDGREALLAAARLADSGRDVGRFFGDLEAHLRGLMVLQTLGTDDVPAELRVSPEQDARLAEQAERVTPGDVVRLLDLLAAGLRALKDGADARTQLELALVKAADPSLEPSARALLARIERLEGRAGNGGEPAGRAPAVAATAAGRAVAEAAPTEPADSDQAPDAAPTEPADGEQAPDVAAAARAAATGSPAPASAGAAERGTSEPASSGPPAGSTAVAITAQLEGQPPVVATTTLPGTPAAGSEQATQAADEAAAAVAADLATDADPTPAVGAVAVVDPDTPAPEAAFSAAVDLDLEAFGHLWPAVLESIQGESSLLAALLQKARPAALAGDELTLAWGESAAFSKRKAEDPANRELIARTIRSVTGSSLRLAYELLADADVTAAAEAPGLSEEELIERFMEEFDAELLPVDAESPEPPQEP
jgi:DNA polymerase-3 subunit gamma/tau